MKEHLKLRVLLEVEAAVVEAELPVVEDVVVEDDVRLNHATMKTLLLATILDSMKGPNNHLRNSY